MVTYKIKDMSLTYKLIGLILLIFLPVILVVFIYLIPNISDKLYEEKKGQLKNLVETSYSIITDCNKIAGSGKLSIEEAKLRALSQIKILRYDDNNYFWINDLSPVMIMHPLKHELDGTDLSENKDPTGKRLFVEMVKVCKKDGQGFVDYSWPKPGTKEAYPKLSYVKFFEGWGWIIGTGMYTDDVNDEIKALTNKIILGFSLAILFAFGLGLYAAIAVTKPIKKLTLASGKVAEGDTSVTIVNDSKDEIGVLSNYFNKMVGNIRSSFEEIRQKNILAENASIEAEKAKNISNEQKEYLSESVDMIMEEMDRFSKGNLTVELKSDKDDAIGQLFACFNKTVKSIRDMISEIIMAINAIASAANQISASTEAMADGSASQTKQALEVAGAVDEMSKTILENTQNVSISAETANKVMNKAKEGGSIVEETIEGMSRIANVVKTSVATVEELGKSSSQIGDIIQVIEDIAAQTNLLALNAAIEAARAGEQGRGFAVVADEVRKLAERTTKATKEIATMIQKIQKDTKEAVNSIQHGSVEVETGKELANKAGAAIIGIVEGTEKVSDIIRQVAVASEEQSAASEEISKNIEAISSVTGESSSNIQQVARAAEDLSRLALNLQNLISRFRLDQAGFSSSGLMHKQTNF